MLAHIENVSKNDDFRKPKSKRTNLLSSASKETLKTVNDITKKQRGISNLTYEKLYKED